ncbi:MAG: hypothetical protein EHM58_17355 [Ignavibacteriae bacterium]|nr:MAG: hypothetical protein EHM58_17355 [Ignavibacteriota bacterium]
MNSTLFINGKIWQEDFSFRKSFGFKEGMITFLSEEPVPGQDIIKEYNDVIDLKGKLVLPSFIDGHVHLVYGSLMMKQIDCNGIMNIDELKRIINEYAGKNPNFKWLVGGNLNVPLIRNQFPGHANFLDEIYSLKPLFLTNYDYHSGICNSAALKASGLLNKLSDFTTDEVTVDNGILTGEVKEKALNFVFEHIPEPALNEKVTAVNSMIKYLHSVGITGVSDITLPDNLGVYSELINSDKLKIKVNSYIPFTDFENYENIQEEISGFPADRFEIKGYKAFYDGALGSETGLFKENYKGKNYNGYKTELAASGEIESLAYKIDETGKQIIIHAIGDLAVSDVLDICAKLRNKNGVRDRRFRIEHAQHIDENDFDRFKELDVIVSAQPLHLKYDANIVKEKLNETIQKRTHNYKALIDRGVVVNFGTDFPIVEINPFANIHMALTRNYDEGIFYPEYRIDLHNCIKCYTINNAYASFDEKLYGSITPGKKANFIIMEEDLFEMEYDEIKDAKVSESYFEGEKV